MGREKNRGENAVLEGEAGESGDEVHSRSQ